MYVCVGQYNMAFISIYQKTQKNIKILNLLMSNNLFSIFFVNFLNHIFIGKVVKTWIRCRHLLAMNVNRILLNWGFFCWKCSRMIYGAIIYLKKWLVSTNYYCYNQQGHFFLIVLRNEIWHVKKWSTREKKLMTNKGNDSNVHNKMIMKWWKSFFSE